VLGGVEKNRMKACMQVAAASALLLLVAVQLVSDGIVPAASLPDSSGLKIIRGLSIADGRRHRATDDDEIAESADDDTSTKKKAANSSPYSFSSTTTEETSGTEAPTTSKSSTSTAKTKSGGKSTDDAKGDDSTNSTTTNSTTAEGKDKGVSEWSFHNVTAAEDMLYNVSASNKTSILPQEAQQKESWAITVLAVFIALTVILCGITAYRRRCGKRHNYEEIESLVV
jgi:hypothetical protein